MLVYSRSEPRSELTFAMYTVILLQKTLALSLNFKNILVNKQNN